MTAIGRAWPHRDRVATAVAWLAILLATAACNAELVPAASRSSLEPSDRIHAQAYDALDRWAQAVNRSGGATISFVGQLTSQIGTWEESVGGNNKAALLAGLVRPSRVLSDDPPSRSEVKWLDGSRVEVNVLSASDALDDLVASAGGDCDDCRPLLVTEANLARGLVETTQGPAEAPIWVFTIDGTAVRVTRVAVDDAVTIDPPPWNVEDPPVGISIDSATGAPDSRRLEVSFVGAVNGRDEPCGAAYAAEAVESELAVVIIVIEHRNPTPGACDLAGRIRTAEVRLAQVLGERAVLEVRQGLPVPLRAP